ncbi:MAG: hypothetical protein ABII18_10950 [bacterium]|nr:hypothetical protein [bacterium]MBU1916970.1 hypothetical protein [bacterium]
MNYDSHTMPTQEAKLYAKTKMLSINVANRQLDTPKKAMAATIKVTPEHFEAIKKLLKNDKDMYVKMSDTTSQKLSPRARNLIMILGRIKQYLAKRKKIIH